MTNSHRDCTHPKTKQARAKCRRATQKIDPSLREAYELGLAMRAKMDKANTVLVRGERVILKPSLAWELRKPAPHPRTSFPGDYIPSMARRQKLRIEVAELLGIPLAEVPGIIKQLKQQSP